MKKTIAVIGDSNIPKDSKEYQLAYKLGKALIDNGYKVQTGGLGGVMEAKGALISKINWLGILVLLTTALQDPVFSGLFGGLIPAGVIDRLGYLLGLAVMYFRYEYAAQPTLKAGLPLRTIS